MVEYYHLEESKSAKKTHCHKNCEKAAAEGDNGDVKCAICLECPHLIEMPYCSNEGSTTRFCIACIETYCEGSQLHRDLLRRKAG